MQKGRTLFSTINIMIKNDGLALSNPFGLLFANILMDSFEKKVMPTLIELGVKCWLRYVDDTFLIVQSKDLPKTILECLNSQSKSI